MLNTMGDHSITKGELPETLHVLCLFAKCSKAFAAWPTPAACRQRVNSFANAFFFSALACCSSSLIWHITMSSIATNMVCAGTAFLLVKIGTRGHPSPILTFWATLRPVWGTVTLKSTLIDTCYRNMLASSRFCVRLMTLNQLPTSALLC